MTLEEAKKIRFCNGRGYSTIEFIQALQLTEEIKNNNTMTEENKQLLLKDLCARLPYGVKAQYYGSEEERLMVDTIETIYAQPPVEIGIGQYGLKIEDIKPYLRPMSSMTDEEKKEFDDFCVIDEFAWNGNSEIGYKNQAFIMSDAIDWLNAHHFDHRGLIPMGLAFEASEGMYKTE